jgi:hypothetical protein
MLWNIFTDCLIISSFEESGPLIEVGKTMAAGKLIISKSRDYARKIREYFK